MWFGCLVGETAMTGGKVKRTFLQLYIQTLCPTFLQLHPDPIPYKNQSSGARCCDVPRRRGGWVSTGGCLTGACGPACLQSTSILSKAVSHFENYEGRKATTGTLTGSSLDDPSDLFYPTFFSTKLGVGSWVRTVNLGWRNEALAWEK